MSKQRAAVCSVGLPATRTCGNRLKLGNSYPGAGFHPYLWQLGDYHFLSVLLSLSEDEVLVRTTLEGLGTTTLWYGSQLTVVSDGVERKEGSRASGVSC